MVGVTIPLVPMAHQYLVTKPIDGVHPAIPMLRDPDHLVYFREEVGGLVAGGYEREPAPWGLDGIPADFNHRLLPPDWERFAPLMEGAVRRVPAIGSAEIVRLINGPEAFTPDGEFILGEAPEVRGFFVAAASAPTASPAPAAWGGSWLTGSWRATRGSTSGTWTSAGSGPSTAPGGSRSSARTRSTGPTTTSATRTRSARRGGGFASRPCTRASAISGPSFGEKSGWERPNWFETNAGAAATSGGARADSRAGSGRRRSRPSTWRRASARASSTRRPSRSSRWRGPGALGLLQRLCGNDMDRPVGSVVYTSMLNERGGIECDFTVTRLGATAVPHRHGHRVRDHDRGFIQRHLPDGRIGLPARRHRGALLLRPLGPASADILPRPRPRRRLEPRPSRTSRRGSFPWAGPGASRSASRTWGARLGALRADRVRPRAVGHALGGGAAARPGRRGLSRHRFPSGSRRATATGAPTSPPTTRRTRPDRVRGEARKG